MNPSTLSPKKTVMLCMAYFCFLLHVYALPPEAKTKIFSLLHDQHYTELQFRLVNDLIIIPVTVDGKKELNFLVDTGTSTPVILHTRYVKNLDLSLGGRVRFQGAGGGDRVHGTVIPEMHLQMGNAFAKNIGVVVLDHNPLDRLKIGGIPVHGIIGASLFYSFAVEIDYLSQVIRLHDSQHFLESDTYSSLPMQVSMSRPLIQVPVQWKDSTYLLKVMVDTGFNNQLLIYDHADIRFRMPKAEKIGLGYSGSIMGNRSKVKRLHLGERTFFDVHILFPLHSDYKAKDAGDGIIGNALLKQFCVVIDYANSKFHIREFVPWQPAKIIHTVNVKAI